MLFNLIHCFLLFLLLFQKASALVFNPVIGPYATGAQVPLEWTLDGSEPAQGWELWFSTAGAGIKLADILPLSTLIVVPFPGGGNGTFQGISGTTVLASTNEVDEVFTTATATFSPSVVSGPTSSGGVGATSSSVPQTSTSTSAATSAAESNAHSTTSSVTTGALLGIVVGTLAVIAIIVVASIALFVHRRRRIAATSYPFAHGDGDGDIEKQLAKKITPFKPSPPASQISISRSQSVTMSYESAPRLPSPPPPLPSAGSGSSSDSRRTAYLNAQLQKLTVQEHADESGSIVYGPLSSVPSENTERAFQPVRSPGTLSPIPELSSSRRTAYLAEQLAKLDVDAAVERRPSSGSLVFGPLSSVPSEGTVRPYQFPSEGGVRQYGASDVRQWQEGGVQQWQDPYTYASQGGTRQGYAASVSTAAGSPLQFRRPGASELTTPVTPKTYVAPW